MKEHAVRIVGGRWKRSKLPVLDKPGLRPTPDRVRETLFNWLGQDLAGWRCLDAFAGSGALGFECGSRGAAEVVLLERDPELARCLRDSQKRLQASALKVEQADALAWMARAPAGHFHLVCLDPPFEADLFERALRLAGRLLAEGGRLYLEAPSEWDEARLSVLGFERLKHGRAGAVHYHLVQRLSPAGAPATLAPTAAGDPP